MVKQGRNIHCTVCGKTYVDPIAAQDHARKHPRTQQPLVMVVPKPPGIQSTINQSVTAEGTGQVNPSSSQHPPPNQSAHERPNVGETSHGIPQVTSLPKAAKQKARAKPKIICRRCPNSKEFRNKNAFMKHKRKVHPTIYQCPVCVVVLDHKTMWKHLKVVHKENGRKRRRKIMRRLRRRWVTPVRNRGQNVPAGPPVDPELPDDDYNSSSEDEEGSSSDDDEQSSDSQDEQEPPSQGNGTQPAAPNFPQPFYWDLRPAGFPTAGTFATYMGPANYWRCMSCESLPFFPNLWLWREHLAMVHGLVE